jgi:hypothetical protein
MRTLKNLKEEEAETYQLTDESYVIIGSEPAAMTDRVVYTPFIYCDMHSGLIINLNHKSPVETQHPHQFKINPYLLGSLLPYCPYWAPNAYAPQNRGHPDLDACGCVRVSPNPDVCGCIICVTAISHHPL